MNREEFHTDLGAIKIHKNVIASIASLAALEIEGIKGIGRDFKSGIMELLGRKDLSAIKVEFDKNQDVLIDIPLVIKYGYNIPDVASKVQDNVRNALEKMTSLSLKDINISVEGIEKN
jgi:uncharacterized alkaline shock family protein YloU